jgi:hypothetical protein
LTVEPILDVTVDQLGHIAEKGEGIDVVPLGAADDAAQYRVDDLARISQEDVVVPAMRQAIREPVHLRH